jgi:hypothetical protein
LHWDNRKDDLGTSQEFATHWQTPGCKLIWKTFSCGMGMFTLCHCILEVCNFLLDFTEAHS